MMASGLFCFHIFVLLQRSITTLLNQARAGLRAAHAWFLKIDPVRIVGMRVHVCVSAPEAINN